MKNYITLMLLVIALYLYLKPNSFYEPSQEEIQSDSYVDKTKNIQDFPYPQISRTFKRLSQGKTIIPIEKDESLPSATKELRMIRTSDFDNVKTRMYLPDYYRKDRLSGNPDKTEEYKPFETNEDKSENSWTDKNVSEHPKFYNSDVKDELTNIGSFFDENNKYNDKTSPYSESLHSDSCFKDRNGNTFCEDNTRLQLIPPKLNSPNNPLLNTIGPYQDNMKIDDMKDRVINGGVFFDNIKASVNNSILSNYDNNPLEVSISY